MVKQDVSSVPVTIRWPLEGMKTAANRFHTAVLTGNCKKIRKLVKLGCPVDVHNQDGQTGLFIAATLGKKCVVKALLKLGANPNARCLPDGYTSIHGACYIGSIGILRELLVAGGDLRLSDTKRQRPIDWTQLQDDIHKRKATRDFIEKIRFCIMRTELNDMKTEIHDKVENRGLSFFSSLWNMIGKFTNRNIINAELLDKQIFSTGFGKVYFGAEVKCNEAIGLPSISETADLKYDSNPKAPSWINGKFSTFIPMTWHKKNTAVTCRVLRRKTVEEAVADILITELSVLVRLRHPQILLVLAVCQEENYDSLSLVFEKVSLGSLYFFLHQQNLRMKSVFATDIVMQISEALDYIHGSGFLHCGISSHAVMLVSETQAKLASFEYATPEDATRADSFLSSRHPWLDSDSHLSVIRNWMAPEVLIGTHRHSQASDVYSLCCVMWEMIVGDVPWMDYDLPSLKTLFIESPGLQLHLRKDIIPPLWLSVLKVGLKRKREERDLDFKEVRYMMTLAKERSSLSSMGAAGDRKSLSKISMKSLNTFVPPPPPNAQGGGDDWKPMKVSGIDVVDLDNEQFNPSTKVRSSLSSTSMRGGDRKSLSKTSKKSVYYDVPSTSEHEEDDDEKKPPTTTIGTDVVDLDNEPSTSNLSNRTKKGSISRTFSSSYKSETYIHI